MSYAELRCRSHYSFLRGGSSPDELMRQAQSLGLHALAITDRNGVYGIPKAYLAEKECASTRLISGAEFILTDHPPLTVLAQNRSAYGLMCRALTELHRTAPKGAGSLSFDQFMTFGSEPPGSGWIILSGLEEDARHSDLKDQFGSQLFTTLHRPLDGNDADRTHRALQIRNRWGIPILATQDVLYHTPDRRPLQDVLTCIREGTSVQEGGFLLQSNSERHLKSGAEMIRLFSDLPEAVHQTGEVADSCSFSPSELKYRYPSEWIPAGFTAQSYLEHLVQKGVPHRYPDGAPDEVHRQIRHELSLIGELGFADYFLTIYDIVEFARGREILCQGRGSAANSVVCYVLGITAIDPIRMNLLFERFISVERGEPPDIDVDFEHDRREEVLQYVYEKYGRDRAAMVSAVITYRRRSALREVAKALGVQIGTTSSREVKKTIQDHPLRPQIEQLASEISGFPRHLSIHSGGFTLSADLLTEIVPVEPATMPGRTIVQWDKYDLDALGLLKVDLLSLGMLSAIRRALDLTGMKLTDIPPDDPATYQMIQRSDTISVFQIESRAQMSMLPRLLPESFYDLVVEIALVRPGPIVGKMVHPYLRRRRGLEKYTLPHPKLEPILGRTYGVPIFQEQVMKMAVELADFTPGESDRLRRAIGAWRSQGSIDEMGKKLMRGLMRHGLPQEFSENVFKQIQGFAEYGFPESHSASFALLAYASCYLKWHHPAEFLCALLNSQPMGFYAPHTLIDDAKRHGVTVLGVDPIHSQWDACLTASRTVRLGFHSVVGFSRADYDHLDRARQEKPFDSLADFIARARPRSSVLQSLAMGDAFRCFALNQRDALWECLSLQLDLLEASGTSWGAPVQGVFPGLSPYEAIVQDYQSFRLSVRGHPMSEVRKRFPHLEKLSTARARKASHGTFVEVPGLSVVLQRPPTAKGTAFATIEDEFGFLDLILHKPILERYKETILEQSFLIVGGQIQRDGESVSLIVRRVKPFLESIPYERSISEGWRA